MFPVAVGDIHGRLDLLNAVIGCFSGRQFVLLGDFVDRGPHSRACLARVRELVEQGRAVACLGNHDQFMIDVALHGLDRAIWVMNGGEATLENYTDAPEAFLADAQWMREHLHQWYVYKHVLFSHAMRPSEADPRAHIEGRPFDTPTYPLTAGLTASVHGHTPATNPEFMVVEDGTIAAYIDIGAYKTGVLCALDLETMAFHLIRLPDAPEGG